ncbi:HAMP domain-containing protein [Streptomyces hyaluromycini]|uniref:HAMP domain-containing protein n=1 Tax=Streptomyces hyaluromycini TaxID=1377993 RepID=UPI000B5C9B5F|nr:methyl-accepting chemotaxis protein [Streptomyces hyaluromycini]
MTRARARLRRSAAVVRGRALIRGLTPRRARVRFAMLFGLLFIASGAVLLGITYLLVNRPTHNVVTAFHVAPQGGAQPQTIIRPGSDPGSGAPPDVTDWLNDQLSKQTAKMHDARMHQLLVQSGIALTIMAAISVVLSWLLARRVLQPVRTLTAGICRISAGNAHERLAVEGPRDEVSELADSVDGLLERLGPHRTGDGRRRHRAPGATGRQPDPQRRLLQRARRQRGHHRPAPRGVNAELVGHLAGTRV